MRFPLRRIASTIALLLIAAGAFEPFYFRIFTIDRARFHEAMVSLQYRKAPGLREHFLEVRAWTRPGETIAIFPTYTRWQGGYLYIFARAVYPLTGRTVLPLVGSDDRPLLANLSRADAIAVWHGEPAGIPGFAVSNRSRNGVLLRRIR